LAPYRIAVVIPAYNEQDRLPGTLAKIAVAQIPGFEVAQIYVAENGSNDNTAAVAAAVGERLGLPLVVERLKVAGKAQTLAQVMPLAARGVDGVLFMDADNATDLEELRHFSPDDRCSVQIGSRYVPGASIVSLSSTKRSWPRRLLSGGMRALSHLLLRLPEHDTQCGFKLFPAACVPVLFGPLRSSSWVFDAEILARAHRAQIPVHERPVRWVEMPGSKVRPVRDGLGSLIGLVGIWWYIRGASKTNPFCGIDVSEDSQVI
jgi:dolichyl-phosphate beta-glucosyltransferase